MGLKEDAILVPIIEHQELIPDFMALLRDARDNTVDAVRSMAEFGILDGWHFEMWERRRAAHATETADIALFRRDSLDASHTARLVTLRDQIANVREERIRRMRTSQIARAEGEYRQAIEDLEAAKARADILFRRVAVGTLRVEN